MSRNTSEETVLNYVLEHQIGFKLRLAYQKHAETFAQMLPDVTPTQFAVLWKLLDLGTTSQNELGRHVAMDAATIKGVIDRLRKRGWVQTEPSRTDLRRLDVSLTPSGTEKMSGLVATAHQISQQTTRGLRPSEERQLLALLDKLLQ